MLTHKLKRLVDTHSLIKSISLHFLNLATGIVSLIIILWFFDLEIYGRFFQLLTFSLLLSQVVVAGFGNSMIADLSKNDLTVHNTILKYYRIKVRRVQIAFVLLIGIIHAFLELVRNSYTTNYVVLITIISGIVFGASNKLLFMFISIPLTYNRFVFLSSIKNITYVFLVVLSATIGSNNFLLLTPFLIELLTYISIQINLYKIKSDKSNLPFIGNKTTLSIHAAWHALYFEYICKLDILLFPFVMDPKTFGAYAILANANESIHALYASVRTQVTPMIRGSADMNTLPPNINLKQPLLISGVLLFIGYFVSQFILNARDSLFPSFHLVYFVLAITTLIFYRIAILGFISIQRGNPALYTYLYASHTIINLLTICMYFQSNSPVVIILFILLGTTIATSFTFNRISHIR